MPSNLQENWLYTLQIIIQLSEETILLINVNNFNWIIYINMNHGLIICIKFINKYWVKNKKYLNYFTIKTE